MGAMSRRRFLRTGVAGAASVWFTAEGLFAAERAASAVGAMPTAEVALRPAGTTLSLTYGTTAAAGAYRRLSEQPGFPIVVRVLPGASAQAGREARRVSLACIVHLTDVHLIDTQSPGRVEFLDRYADAPTNQIPFDAAYRPQEPLTGQVAASMIDQIRTVGLGPITARGYDCCVSTGDVIDNCQTNELGWHIRLLDGGSVTANSGGPTYEGVMDNEATTFDVHYWHPDDPRPHADLFRSAHGFPSAPGFLAAAVRPFPSQGIPCRWFATYGNHDGLLSGNAPPNGALDAISTGSLKVVNLPAGVSPNDLQTGLVSANPSILASLATAPTRVVTADANRRSVTAAAWVDAHLASPDTPGPTGHGLSEAHRTQAFLGFTFQIAQGVLGISLDTCSRGGYADGNLFQGQVDWLLAQLKKASSREGGTDQLVILFSHHNLGTLDNPAPSPVVPTESRVSAAALSAILFAHPNVVGWINGHSHVNRVVAHPNPSGTGGFFEILTAAHVDWPEHARIVEVVDNRDGTLSMFGTLIEHAGPAQHTSLATHHQLAAFSRELAFNDPQVNLNAVGAAEDRNVELIVPVPFALAAAGVAGGIAETPAVVAAKPGRGGAVGGLAATGGSSALAVAGAAAAAGALGAAALARHATDDPD